MLKNPFVAFTVVCLSSSIALAQQTCPTFGAVDVSGEFTSIDAFPVCPRGRSTSYLIPLSYHYIIKVDPSVTTGSVYVDPPNILEPFVEDSTLKFRWGSAVTDRNVQDDEGSNGVEIILPSLTQVNVFGINSAVSIDAAGSSLTIENSGVFNSVYLKNATKLTYKADGGSSTAELEATEAVVEVAGANAEVIVSGDVTSGSIDGLDCDLSVGGNVASLQVAGVGLDITVGGTGGCDGVESEGIINSCSTGTVTIPGTQLDCLSGTDTAYTQCGRPTLTGLLRRVVRRITRPFS